MPKTKFPCRFSNEAEGHCDSLYLDRGERFLVEYTIYNTRIDHVTNVTVRLYLDGETIKTKKITVPVGESVADAVTDFLPMLLSPDCLDDAIEEQEGRVADAQIKLDALKDFAEELR